MTRLLSTLRIRSSWGVISVGAVDGAVIHCQLPRMELPPDRRLGLGLAEIKSGIKGNADVLRQAENFIRELFRGCATECPRLVEQPGSLFFRRIMRALRDIPAGEVITYGALACRAGYPGAARAAGTACGANALPLFIPCHRIVAAGGRIGGFSSGMAWKRTLLAVESAMGGLRACA